MEVIQNEKEFIGKIKFHEIVIVSTSPIDYEMARIMLVEKDGDFGNEYYVVEGYHCSCYGFDDTKWEVMKYDRKDLIKLACAKYNLNKPFWKNVRQYFEG